MNTLIKENRGMAIPFVLGTVALLTYILYEFTFDTKLNQIKIYNLQDKAQARLASESGLNFALARLRLYQEARNKLEKNENLKKMFSPDQLEQLLNSPFVYPLPSSKSDDIFKKNAINDFEKNVALRGTFMLSVDRLTGFLNPNSLRIIPKKQDPNQLPGQSGIPGDLGDQNNSQNPDGTNPQGQDGLDTNPDDPNNKNAKKTPPIHEVMEKKIKETISRMIEEKVKSDDEFNSKYSNINVTDLVNELKYYVNDKGKIDSSITSDMETKFTQKNITPKHAPMSSIEEFYLLPSWPPEIIKLVLNRFSVHEIGVIGINEMTIEDLKSLFPAINPVQIEEFFKSRDGDKEKNIEGKKFQDEADFKERLINELKITTNEDYDALVKELKSAKIRFDVAGKLYKITSTGTVNNAEYKLIAFVDLPIKEPPEVKKNNSGATPPSQTPDDQNANTNPDNPSDGKNDKNGKDDKEEKAKPLELLPPRVVEIRIE